jgi:hypothetical protein
LEVPCVTEVPGEDDPIPVREAAYDAYKVTLSISVLSLS